MKIFLACFLFIMSSENAFSASSSGGGKPLAFAASPSGPSDDKTSGNEEIPQLPAPDPDKDIPSIQLGETIKFDEIGPVIINTDGTSRRIDNWSTLSEREKEVTWRRISKRNEERRKMLMEQAEQNNKSKQEGKDEL